MEKTDLPDYFMSTITYGESIDTENIVVIKVKNVDKILETKELLLNGKNEGKK